MKLKINNNVPKIYQSLNATYQGYFNQHQLEDRQQISGEGIVIDDQFNFFLSNWKEDQLDGPSFARLITGQIIYGQFEKGHPKGTITIVYDKYSLFLARETSKDKNWSTNAVLIDNKDKIFYLLELTPRENSAVDLDRTQKIGGQTTRSEGSKNQWKVKIIDRCGMKRDGSLSCFSKKIKNISKSMVLEYDSSVFTEEQRNHLKLIASVMGTNLKDSYLISPQLYLMKIAQLNTKFEAKLKKEGSQDVLFITLKQEQGYLIGQYLGLAINLKSGDIRSVGSYDSQHRLSGLCVQFSRRGTTYAGIFKENLIVKEYSNSPSPLKAISTFQMREFLQNQHMKSLNYLNTCIYVSVIQKITSISVLISKYTQLFERQYEKRHLSYNDSENSEFSEGAGLNILKYRGFQQPQTTQEVKEMETKRPGFIMKKDKSRQGRSRSSSIREVGKITKGYSPSLKGRSPLKISSRKRQ